jgi:peptidoglycan/xylan/chitin deacetylase (PgdA/CDA1 family)
MRAALIAVALAVALALPAGAIAQRPPVTPAPDGGHANKPQRTELAPSRTTRACPAGYVALTYDDGPTLQTRPLLEQLAKARMRATFFNVGANEEAMTDVVLATKAAGHDFGNHTYWHVWNAATTWTPEHLSKDIGDTTRLHEWITGDRHTYFRPPFDQWMPDEVIDAVGLTQVTWTLDTHSYDGRSAHDVADAFRLARGGDIMLLHDGYETEVQAVPRIAQILRAKGLCAGRLVPSATPTTNSWGESFPVTVGPW